MQGEFPRPLQRKSIHRLHFRPQGVLLGILGFLLVYVLNQNPRIDLHMHPGFVALFAFCLAVTVVALWEIFEFAMDQLFRMNMRKPMFGDPPV